MLQCGTVIIRNILHYITKFIELTLTFGHFKVDVIRNKVIRFLQLCIIVSCSTFRIYDYWVLNKNFKLLFSPVCSEVELEWFSPKCRHFVAKLIEWTQWALIIWRNIIYIGKVCITVYPIASTSTVIVSYKIIYYNKNYVATDCNWSKFRFNQVCSSSCQHYRKHSTF